MRWFYLSLSLFFCCEACDVPYVTAHLMGQLVNQLFIIAATCSLAWDHGATPLFPDLLSPSEDPLFKIPLHREKLFFHLNAEPLPQPIHFCYHEPDFFYREIPFRPNTMLYGWFQSEKYFKKHREKIVSLFSPSPEIEEYLESRYSELIHHPNTVSVHMRTYEFELLPESRDAYVTYGRAYVEQAMSLFPEDSLFVIFSNRMDWAKEELKEIKKNLYFVENELHYHDLYLMSKCKDNIICNSSFSWWGAYLNSNPHKRVIVPPKWFNDVYVRDTRDLIPEEWIRLERK